RTGSTHSKPGRATLAGTLQPPAIDTDSGIRNGAWVAEVTANIDLSAAEIQLVNEVGREQALGRALYPVLDRYDFVLVDCQPS
ncbi:AAA family ATPase, partial [Escherichia coli]|uniref:ParA family protein n=1 Tax=Escherichia coli TaxID=562 RepID=UPI001EDA34E2